jgi:hypothetical protein
MAAKKEDIKKGLENLPFGASGRSKLNAAIANRETKKLSGGTMSDRKSAKLNLAAILSAEIRRRSGPAGCSEGRWRIRCPELKAWSAPFRAVIIGALLVSVAWGRPAMARGGFMHGMGSFGMHGGPRTGSHAGGREGLLTPAYVLIIVSKITDAEAFKAAVRDLIATTAPFAGRLAADMDKPASWEGAAP